MNNDAAIAADRNAYRAIRSSSKLSPKDFDRKAFRLAHELADGEEITSRHWAQAARHIAAGA